MGLHDSSTWPMQRSERPDSDLCFGNPTPQIHEIHNSRASPMRTFVRPDSDLVSSFSRATRPFRRLSTCPMQRSERPVKPVSPLFRGESRMQGKLYHPDAKIRAPGEGGSPLFRGDSHIQMPPYLSDAKIPSVKNFSIFISKSMQKAK